MKIIKVGNLYYSGEGNGDYEKSTQEMIFGSNGMFKQSICGMVGNTPSGVSVYEFSAQKEKAMKLSRVSVPEIVGGIMLRQQYGFIPMKDIVVVEAENYV